MLWFTWGKSETCAKHIFCNFVFNVLFGIWATSLFFTQGWKQDIPNDGLVFAFLQAAP